ncbi:adenosine deaminase-related growth [Schizopora paradoxa]|uniref:adenosine deaminase n=1 Tax=Schizopora paradoxa TaxID=27342 RepID=A0A0H2RFA6_9AGAM|nr:adenosine deaminase-related growth [Schizopora paradoxa]
MVDNSIESYLAARNALISEERSIRRDFRELHKATDAELHADQIVRAIKLEEAKTIWAIDHPDTPNVFPGMSYLSARSLITKTKIFQLISKMPKGALLHSHLDAMVNAADLLKMALEEPAMHVKVSTRLMVSSLESTMPIFRGLKPSEYSDESSITSSTYVPGTWVQIRRARESFASEYGGSEAFDAWVIASITINPKEAYETHNTVKKIWKKFENTFEIAEGFTTFFPLWKKYLKEFFMSSIEDGISFIETRLNFFLKYLIDAKGEETVSHRDLVVTFDEVVQDVKNEMNRQGRPEAFIGARIIYATLRFISCEELNWYVDDCIELKQEFPHLIAGFDLVGSENDFKPLIFYIEPLLRFKHRVQELGIDLPLILHAGETFGDGSEPDSNLYDAILLGTKRIGHGFSLAKHPRLIELVKERGIAVEVCPISNEILRLTSSVCTHPLASLINQDVAVALCSDDPSVFGNMGLSFDFFQVLMGSDINGLLTLGMLARQSLEHCTLDNAEKARAITLWEKQWAVFIESVVDGRVFAT